MPDAPLSALLPDWPAPSNVLALCTTRLGGVSAAPYDSLNIALHVGDDTSAVATNRARLAEHLPAGANLSWLSQVHGAAVVEAASTAIAVPEADAQWSREPGLACVVMTADCLPVLLCDVTGQVVAAAHAGWRGLQGGVLEATVAAMAVAPGQLLAWLGPAIGPQAFEVGPEVRSAFLDAADAPNNAATQACFRPSPERAGHWYADLYALARVRLSALGVSRVFGGEDCSHSDAGRFFSHRRDGQTGRMASLVMLRQDS